jgi:hypothetical protein
MKAYFEESFEKDLRKVKDKSSFKRAKNGQKRDIRILWHFF